MAETQSVVLLGRGLMIVFRPTAADKQDIANLNITTLRGRADINVLVLATRHELFIRHSVAIGSVEFQPDTSGIGTEVRQEATTRNSMFG